MPENSLKLVRKRKILVKEFAPTVNNFPIIGIQSPETRSLNVGYIEKQGRRSSFIPCRLNLGGFCETMAEAATIQSLNTPLIKKIITQYNPSEISTITILREAAACHLSTALYQVGVNNYYSDCFIGATHVKKANLITASYQYENKEGLCKGGFWIIADSIAAGRNLTVTLKSLLPKYQPKEILFLVPIGNRWGINRLSQLLNKHKIKATFLVWGALFGLNPENRYDEPWGLPDCEPIDYRDQQTFISIYGPDLCVGGDFGNDFYCVYLALELYKEQLKKLKIKPKIPSLEQVLKIYKPDELIVKLPLK
ncbi:hypothetical protein A2767_05200 [Candidatus Roizmanbacteria bacterium RIFCSPHIGHO2_01_FULL_35_10]|uniref:Uncharacterized protein n=1 Tax=Candidatus Roizmanbacteria bacterium RIFCSPLOWO2_01_FULL_35_13 TaxID=1802055 RepID=A0A1F7IBI0_9BACT|nr:MAG: hypothetical protein A2767_05200 [Candidatus Roizmanbacteria bacterium RIFCSPHIGHO2_01_FULL_35_10]OGK40716.1 MAG: hypothetical protein A3A74_03815 [Candidatus Roizmanbacteria bacterium RIFCSPLOWO2_01_FULL_35_13]